MPKLLTWLAPLAIAGLAAGCGASNAATVSQGATSPAATTPAATSPAATPSSAAPSPSASATQTSPPAIGACQAGALTGAVGSTQGAAGHMLYVFTLTNSGSSECQLDGYPALALLEASGTQIPIQQSHGADMAFPAVSPSPVHLAAGAKASFSVGFSDVPSTSNCPTATLVKITPPQVSGAVDVKTTMAPCQQIDVSPVVAGSNGVTS